MHEPDDTKLKAEIDEIMKNVKKTMDNIDQFDSNMKKESDRN